MSSPTRSGTTHVIVESILQEHGWEGGWRYLLELAGNLATITARSFGVQQGILKKRFGAGPTIDSFAFVEITSAHEIGFVYPKKTVVLPVQIAIVRGTAQSNNARRFIEYLLTEAGQKLLLDPAIRRFPLDTKLLQEEQAGILQHYYQQLPKNLNYDADLSQQRYEVVNFLFDQAITRRLLELKIFWQHYHSLQSSSQAGGSLEALELLIQAKNLITQVPISADSVAGGEIQLAFQPYHSGITIPFGQQKIQKQWQLTMQENYSQAMDTLVQAAQVLGIDLRNIKKVKK